MSDNRSPLGDERLTAGLINVIPAPIPGINLEGFRFDPLTDQIVKLINGSNTIGAIVKQVGTETIEVVRRIKLLKDGGVISWPSETEPMPRVTLPASPRMSHPPSSAAPTVRERITKHRDTVEPIGPVSQSSRDHVEPTVPIQRDTVSPSSSAPRDLGAGVGYGSRVSAIPAKRVTVSPDGTVSIAPQAPSSKPPRVSEVPKTKVSTPAASSVRAKPRVASPPPESRVSAQPLVAPSPPASRVSAPPRTSSLPVSRSSAPPRTSKLPKALENEVSGSLDNKDVQTVVMEYARSTFSGSIRFEQDDEVITFHFIRGEPKGVEALASQHDLGKMLQRAGFIDANVLRTYRASLSQDPDSILALRRAGINDKNTMAKYLVWRGETLFRETQGWIDGTYTVSPGTPFPANVPRLRLKLGTGKSVEWNTEKLTTEQVEYLSSIKAKYLAASENVVQITATLKLGDREKRYIKHLLEDLPMQISHAMTISSLPKATTRKIIFFLIQEGAFDLYDSNPEGEAPVPLDELESIRKQLEIDDHFTALGTHAVSIEEEIRKRYEKRIREFDPKRYREAEPIHIEVLRAIQGRIELAWNVLGNDEGRREYRKTIFTKFQLDNFFNLQLEKAEAAIKLRQNASEALPLAQSAWDIKPGHIAAGSIITQALKALGRGGEAIKYGKGLSNPPPRTTPPYKPKS
ncbi:MAG: hypothetical protein GY854_35045 [Deltaproteobacteria bacterium]|nr:hypothetical protein [Deltaproteobacteria bacterium]